MDVGTGDPYFAQNRAFHAELGTLGVAHRYQEWPGGHDWRYWQAHLGESLGWLAGRLRGG